MDTLTTGMGTFIRVYTEELERAVKDHPTEYPWYPSIPVSSVVAKIHDALKRGTYSNGGYAFKATCKRLGIKCTYTAINGYVRDGQVFPLK